MFFDGQNLFHAAKEVFGYKEPDYDPRLLAMAICEKQGWQLIQVRFYTGVPDRLENPVLQGYWTRKLDVLGKHPDVTVIRRTLKYSYRPSPPACRKCGHRDPHDGLKCARCGWQRPKKKVPREKGIDIRIALDCIRLTSKEEFDVAVVSSQDQDLAEIPEYINAISAQQRRTVEFYSAFPFAPGMKNSRGINHMRALHIDRGLYDACRDPRNYY